MPRMREEAMSRTQPELSVEMWWCGEDECDCTEPQVVVRYPLDRPKPGIGVCEVIAEGPFIANGYGAEPGEVAAQKKWLRSAERWYKTRHVCPQCDAIHRSEKGRKKA